jgi:ATP-dependent Lhr-like helicase
LRALRNAADAAEPLVLAATDPANPYGAALPWPESAPADAPRPQRAAGALVVLRDGQLIGYLSRTESQAARAVAGALAALVDSGRRRVMLVASVDGVEPAVSALAPVLSDSGFTPGSRGWIRRPMARAG